MPNARLDQSVRESVQTGNPKARLDQVVREAIILPGPLTVCDDDYGQQQRPQRQIDGYYLGAMGWNGDDQFPAQQVYEIVFSST